MDEKIISFISFLHDDPENQSQLLNDFQSFYFGEKPMLTNEQIKRLLHGYMRNGGLLEILKSCHRETYSVKTKAIITLVHQLTDNNLCH